MVLPSSLLPGGWGAGGEARAGMDRGKSTPLAVDPRFVAVAAGLVAAVLVLMSVGFSFLDRYSDIGIFKWLSNQFKVNREENISAFFSGLLIIVDAGLLALVWGSRRGEARALAWLLLVPVFLFLSFDELFGVHEHLIEPLREALNTSGLLYFSWTVVYAIGVVAIAAAFFPVWWALEARQRLWFASAAVIYVSGAVGFEALGGARLEAVGTEGDLVYAALYTAEEALEMAGLIVFMYGLLVMVASRRVSLTLMEPTQVKPAALKTSARSDQ